MFSRSCTEKAFSQVQKVEKGFQKGSSKSKDKKLCKWMSKQVFGKQRRSAVARTKSKR